MKRRNFVHSLLIAPAIPAVVPHVAEGQQAPPPKTTPQQQPVPQPNTPARQVPRQPPEIPKLNVTAPDLTAEPAPHYFTTIQFATLRKLAETLVPPLKNNPGALDAQAPEFLDFLLSVSPGDRQKLYQFGLDRIELQSKEKFQHSFGDLDAKEADRILRPLLVARPWPEDLPNDPLQNFMAQVHEDLRMATMNSRQWAAAAEKSGHRFSRGFRGSGYYWYPIDPISEG